MFAHEIDWVADGSGDATAILTKVDIDGIIMGISMIPDGVDPPDANWDLTIVDEFGLDLLRGLGTNLVATQVDKIPEMDNGQAIPCVTSQVTVTVDEAGADNAGKIIIYWK